jgi:hypothetical protein
MVLFKGTSPFVLVPYREYSSEDRLIRLDDGVIELFGVGGDVRRGRSATTGWRPL